MRNRITWVAAAALTSIAMSGPALHVADITGNGVVDVDDLLTVINSWS